MGHEQIVVSVENLTRRQMEQKVKLLESTRIRLVWFVAISGFVLLNGKSLYDGIGSRSLNGLEILIVNTPMLISVFSALAAHFISDVSEIRSNMYFNSKMTLIELFKAKTIDGRSNYEEFESIMNDDHPEILKLRRNADSWTRAINITETITILFLVLEFLWIIIYPLLFIQ